MGRQPEDPSRLPMFPPDPSVLVKKLPLSGISFHISIGGEFSKRFLLDML
jgi:hypothetical protein